MYAIFKFDDQVHDNLQNLNKKLNQNGPLIVIESLLFVYVLIYFCRVFLTEKV